MNTQPGSARRSPVSAAATLACFKWRSPLPNDTSFGITTARISGIKPAELTEARARRERTTVSFPIWVIAHELVIAAYLERILGWTYAEHEPRGHRSHRGDWGFRTNSGRDVFVEVKCHDEPTPIDHSGVGVRGDYRVPIKKALREAYRQLPDDGRATLVVVVGDHTMEIPSGIRMGDLFQALFGEIQVRFRALPTFDPTSIRMGPSGRQTHVNINKRHSRMGHAVGLNWRALVPYGVPNPFAKPDAQLSEGDLEPLSRVTIDAEGRTDELQRACGEILDVGVDWTGLARGRTLTRGLDGRASAIQNNAGCSDLS